MKIKNKLLLTILLLTITIIPINTLAYSDYIIASGKTIGIEVNSNGVLVVGFYEVDNSYLAKDAGFEIVDKIIKVNETKVNSISEMVEALKQEHENETIFTITRDNKEKQ